MCLQFVTPVAHIAVISLCTEGTVTCESLKERNCPIMKGIQSVDKIVELLTLFRLINRLSNKNLSCIVDSG